MRQPEDLGGAELRGLVPDLPVETNSQDQAPTTVSPPPPLRVGLVACCKTKLKVPAVASRLYSSPLFQKAVEYCRRHYDRWFILSAKYGLVEPGQILEPYDQTLANQSKSEREQWASRVIAELENRGLHQAKFFLHAGGDYAAVLRGKLNCELPLAGLAVGRQLAWYESQAMNNALKVHALEVHQGERVLYTFAVDGKTLHRFAAVSRVGRGEDGTLRGYQRPEVLAHIAQIRAYLESENAILPNAIVLAFDGPVTFKPTGKGNGFSRPGELTIPLVEDDQAKPAWIVDGQQRAAAVRDLTREGFPLCVTAFVAHDLNEQREQFILVNNTKPLPKGLVYELLPQTDALLPQRLAKQRFPVHLLDRLNRDQDSPFHGRVRMPTCPEGIIKDSSILAVLNNSLTDGVLYQFRGRNLEDSDEEAMLRVLKDFWSAVATVFPEAWERPPKLSRLTHGAGIIALGLLMDEIADHFRDKGLPTQTQFMEELKRIAPLGHWIPESGDWNLEGFHRRWDEMQNTPKDTRLLANVLCKAYRSLVRQGDGKTARN